MPRKATLTNEQRLERKRAAERIRMERIRSDPEQYAQWTTRRRQMYFEKHKLKRQKVFTELSVEFTENTQLNQLAIKSENINDESMNSYDPSDEHSDGMPLSSLSNHMDGNETYDHKVEIDNKPLIPQISIHEYPEPLAIIDVPHSSSSQPKVSSEVPWGLFRAFECRIRKELDSKDKIIEELKLLNVKYKTQIKLLNEEKMKSENKCPYCDRKNE